MLKQEAISAFGGVSALAKAIRVTPAAIYQWGDTIPELRVFQIRQLIKERSPNVDASDTGPAAPESTEGAGA